MKCFACLLDTDGHGISDRARARVEAAALYGAREYHWELFDGAAVCTVWDADGGDVIVERTPTHVAVGTARLDNRSEVRRLLDDADGTDLALILRAVARHGSKYIRNLLGDFAFVVWHAQSRTAIAACDAFAVRDLYYAQHDGVTLFASRAEPISATDRYELAYLADIILMDCVALDKTVYSGVSRLMPASTITVRNHVIRKSTYWTAQDFGPLGATPIAEGDAADAVRDLFIESVCQRVDPAGRTWSQLSGGLDSSSVVSTASWLAEQGRTARGLGGTVTFVDGSGTGADEREYTHAVIRRWNVPNLELVDLPVWLDDDCASGPMPDQPSKAIAAQPRDALACAAMREAGARVLLTGWGSDELFTGSMMYFADRLVRAPFQALREMAHLSAVGRVSFWDFAYRNALVPFLPTSFKQHALRGGAIVPDWLRWSTFKQFGITTRILDARYDGRIGSKYHHFILAQIESLGRVEDWKMPGDLLSVRHPFLYRPLVELAMRLPPELCARPHARKWVLRQAMRGILPEAVRTRIGKGGGGDSVPRAFKGRRDVLRTIFRESILAELGLVELDRLRRAADQATAGAPTKRGIDIQGPLMRTLSVETWLRVRSGRWPHGVATPLQSVRRQLQPTNLSV